LYVLEPNLNIYEPRSPNIIIRLYLACRGAADENDRYRYQAAEARHVHSCLLFGEVRRLTILAAGKSRALAREGETEDAYLDRGASPRPNLTPPVAWQLYLPLYFDAVTLRMPAINRFQPFAP